MGGTQEMFDEAREIQVLEKDFRTIWYGITETAHLFPPINRDKVCDSVEKDIQKFFTNNGLHFEKVESGERGGGVETLLEIVQLFLKTLNLLVLFSSVFKLLKDGFTKYMEGGSTIQVPGFTINLSFISSSDVGKLTRSHRNEFISIYTLNLINTGYELTKYLKQRYQIFDFDFHINVQLPSFSSNLNISFPKKFLDDLTVLRLKRIIEKHRVTKNLETEYSPQKMYLIKRSDTLTRKDRRKPYVYYLLISQNILATYEK